MRGDQLALYTIGASLRNVSLAAGYNTKEGAAFAPMGERMDAQAFAAYVKHILYEGVHQRPVNETCLNSVMEVYPPSSTDDNRPLAADFLGDLSFICGSRFITRMHSTLAVQPAFSDGRSTFMYRFNAGGRPGGWGVEHGDEVPFAFDQPSWSETGAFTPAEEDLSEAMGALWASFAATRLPAAGGFAWPAYHNHSKYDDTDVEMLLGTSAAKASLTSEAFPRAHFCNFWTNFTDAGCSP